MTTARLLLTMAAKVHSVRLFDISRACLHTPCRTDVYVEPPAEHTSAFANAVW